MIWWLMILFWNLVTDIICIYVAVPLFAMLTGIVPISQSMVTSCPHQTSDRELVNRTEEECSVTSAESWQFCLVGPPKYVCSVKTNVKSKFASGWVQCVCLWASPSLTWDAGIGQVDHWYVIAITLWGSPTTGSDQAQPLWVGWAILVYVWEIVIWNKVKRKTPCRLNTISSSCFCFLPFLQLRQQDQYVWN